MGILNLTSISELSSGGWGPMVSATHPLRGTDGDTEAQGGREMHLQFARRTGPSFPLTQSRIQGFGHRCPPDLPHSPTGTCFLCVSCQ